MQEWIDGAPVGKWTATVTLVKDGVAVAQFDLTDVSVLESGAGDLDPETGLPLPATEPLRLSISGEVADNDQ
jgi:hypothetical protein